MKLNRNPLIALLAVATLTFTGCGVKSNMTAAPQGARVSPALQALIAKSDVSVTPRANKDWKVIEGEVTKLLPDDSDDRPHQHFLVNVDGNIVKVAHNTALAPYVPVKVGDSVTIKCEYIKQKPNDIAHWTHYDPKGGEGGYIELNGKKYDRI